jgi:hypothetical protein
MHKMSANSFFEPNVMSVLSGQQKQIKKFQRKIDALLVVQLTAEKTNISD